MDVNAQSPRVFISYSWTSEDYQQRIVDLAERLTNDGVHVVLDVWDLKPGHDKFAFMEGMVVDVNVKHVLLMCDPRYAEKADLREGGVGTETLIVSKSVYDKVDQNKFIPVVTERKGDGEAPLPTYISSRMYIDLSDEGKYAAEYERLLRLIFDKPSRKRPAIGKPPAFLSTDDALSPTTHLLQSSGAFSTSTVGGRAQSPRKLMQAILHDLKAQRLIAEPPGAMDEIIVSKIQELKGLRDATLAWYRQLLDFSTDENATADLVSFFEQLITLKDWPEELSAWSNWRGDHIAFFAREVWLYAIAMLIECRRWEVARGLLGTTLCAQHRRQFGPVGYGHLDCYLASLEEVLNRKKNPARVSVLADFVKERADDRQITFEMLMQADFVLTLRHVLGYAPSSRWFPRTLVYRTHRPEPFPVFVRWNAGQLSQGIPALLGMDWRATVLGLQQAKPEVLQKYTFDYSPVDFFSLADVKRNNAAE